MATNDFNRDVWCLLGIPVDAVDMAGAIGAVRKAVADRTPLFLSTPNVNFLVGCQSDAAFRRSVIDSELSVADGMPLVWIARLLGIPLKGRVSGSGLIEALQNRPTGEGGELSVYFFGGEEGVAEKACGNLKEAKSGLRCVGFFNPGFGSVEEMSSDNVIQEINDSDADFVIVSLGAKKGQAWIRHNRQRLSAPVISHLGAVVNFIAGTVNRAPLWVQRAGLEWLWRIKEEPALWRRYWEDGVSLGWLIITKVLPYSVWHLMNEPSVGADQDGPVISSELQGEKCCILLAGALRRNNLQEIRREFRRAATGNCNVELDFKAVSYADSAFLGLLLMLEKNVTLHSKKLYLTGLSYKVINIFKWNALDDLLD